MHASWIRWLATGLLLTSLTACGLKGNLYIPEKQYPQPQQPAKTTP